MATSSLRGGAPRESGIDAALLVLRLTLGILILIHGLSKLPPPSAFIVDVVTKAGLPASSPMASTSARSSRRSCSSSASGRGWRRS